MKTVASLSSLTALLVAPLSAFAQLYSIEVIGPINQSYTYTAALNNHGQVLGTFGGQLDELYLSQNGVQSFPGNLGGLFPTGNGLNDSGDFVGQYLHAGNYHAYVSSGGSVTDLGALGGSFFSAATDINNAGQIVGQTSTATATTRAFSYSNGIMSELGTLGGNVSSASSINAVGDVAGYSTTLAGEYRAFHFSGGLMSDLGTLGGNESFASDINVLGQVVGRSTFNPADSVNSHAFLYNLGAIHDLGTLGGAGSWANAINDSGIIVGGSQTGQALHAFISDGVTMTDLNSLVDFTGTGLQYLTTARDINPSGQIIGEAVNANGFTVGFVMSRLTAVPETSSFGWFAVLILILLALCRRVKTSKLLPAV